LQKEIGGPLSAPACELQVDGLPRGQAGISLVEDTTEMMLISQFGKIIRIDTKQIWGGQDAAPSASSCRTRKSSPAMTIPRRAQAEI